MKTTLMILALTISMTSIAGTEKKKIVSVKSETKTEPAWGDRLRSKMGENFKGMRQI